jgi:hypothetical protein
MASASITVSIARSAPDIFAVLADVEKNAAWSSTAVEGRQTSPGVVGVGTTAREVSVFLGRRIEVDSEIVEFEPDQKLSYVTRGGPFPFRGTFELQKSADDSSALTATFDMRPSGLLRYVDGVITAMAKRQFGADLANLKRLMESGAL